MHQSIKKYLFVFCTLIYLVSINGIPIYLHYCGGDLEAISYFTKTNSCCGEEEAEDEESDCCKNEQHILKTNLDAVHHHTARLLAPTLPLIQFFLHSAAVCFSNNCSAKPVLLGPSPPPLQHSDLIDFVVMRI